MITVRCLWVFVACMLVFFAGSSASCWCHNVCVIVVSCDSIATRIVVVVVVGFVIVVVIVVIVDVCVDVIGGLAVVFVNFGY
jgi:hypothetical protein